MNYRAKGMFLGWLGLMVGTAMIGLLLPADLAAQGKIRIEAVDELAEGQESPVSFVYHDDLGMELRRSAVKLPPGTNVVAIPDGCSVLIKEGPAVKVSIAGEPVDIVVEGRNHTLDVRGNHVIDVQTASVNLTVHGGEPTVKVRKDSSVNMNVREGAPLVRLGDVASKLNPGSQAKFKVEGEELVVEAFKGKVNLVNENGGTVVVEEKKTSSFDMAAVQTKTKIVAKHTEDISEEEMKKEVGEGEPTKQTKKEGSETKKDTEQTKKEGSETKKETKQVSKTPKKMAVEEKTADDFFEETAVDSEEKSGEGVPAKEIKKEGSETKKETKQVSKTPKKMVVEKKAVQETPEVEVTVVEASKKIDVLETATGIAEDASKVINETTEESEKNLDSQEETKFQKETKEASPSS